MHPFTQILSSILAMRIVLLVTKGKAICKTREGAGLAWLADFQSNTLRDYRPFLPNWELPPSNFPERGLVCSVTLEIQSWRSGKVGEQKVVIRCYAGEGYIGLRRSLILEWRLRELPVSYS